MKRAIQQTNSPKISVVVPVYNAEKYLDECLYSIINQTFQDTELIFVNDASKDTSLEILNYYASIDSRVKIIPNKFGQGASNARNSGLDAAIGEYIIFLDADDVFELNMLERAYDVANVNDSDVVYWNYKLLDTNTGLTAVAQTNYKDLLTPDILAGKTFSKEHNPNLFFQSYLAPANWNKLYKRELITKNEIRSQNLPVINDWYFSSVAMFLAEKINFIDECLVLYRYNASGNTATSLSEHSLVSIDVYQSVIDRLNFASWNQELKMSFLNHCLSSFYYEFNNCVENKKAEFAEKFKHFMGEYGCDVTVNY